MSNCFLTALKMSANDEKSLSGAMNGLELVILDGKQSALTAKQHKTRKNSKIIPKALSTKYMHIFVVHAIKRASKEKSLQHHFIITGRRFTANNHRQKHRKYSKKCISSASAASRLPSTETVFYDQFFSFYFKRINLAQCLKNIFFFYWDAYMFFMIHRW